MENMVFLIDLPRLQEGQRTTAETMTFFGTEMIYFLEAMGLERSIIDSIYHFDFTATKDLAFVHNVGGVHYGLSWRRTGYCGLGRAVENLGLATQKRLDIDFVTSSVGSLNDDFLAMLYLGAQGDNGLEEYNWRNPAVESRKRKRPQGNSEARQVSRERLRSHLRQHIRVYFPTNETVRNSTTGSAGTICFQSKWFNSPTFPREILRDCKSVRPGMLMHNKVCANHSLFGFKPWLNVVAIVRTDRGRPIQILGVRWVSKLFGKCIGQACQGSGHERAQAQLPQLGMWGACASASVSSWCRGG